MQPTLALRMFRPTMRMMRPVPVSSRPARSLDGLGYSKTIQLIDGNMEDDNQMLTDCDCSSHHQPAPTRSQENSPGVDPPWYANYRVVVGVAVGAAFYSLGRKLVVDKTMRLNRQNKSD
ncbi:hypothetical protein LCER1_G003690 [Lachnellula cervina]|uniref:Uncharacterized protein n=1 Tax=Lachnellula cervina TaxID=1316786 RepID=A0A7D8US80_9HELO|nr:hypothetical protein LCER1_G003690 [Lachnellula cervina]